MAKIGTAIGAAVVATAACLVLTSLLGRCSSAASLFAVKLLFPFFGLTLYLRAAQPIPSALLLFSLVYLQFPLYAAFVSWGWLRSRLHRALVGIAIVHLAGVLAVFGAGLYISH